MYIPRIKPITNKRLQQLERNTSGKRYQDWKNYVFTRDNHMCQYPGCKSTEGPQAHHIRRWVDARHLRYDTFNGITLCAKCHVGKVTGHEKHYELTFLRIVQGLEKKKKEKDGTTPSIQNTDRQPGTTSLTVDKPSETLPDIPI